MKTQLRVRSSFSIFTILLLLITVFAMSACGDDANDASQNTGENKPNPDGSPKPNDGETKCGTNTCGPGTYCAAQDLGVCETGCSSDLNCISTTHRCEVTNEISAVGLCVRLPETDKPDTDKPDTDKPDTDKPDTDKPDTDLEKGCLAYCARVHECGRFIASELASCNYVCRNETSPDESRAVAECQAATNSCTQFLDECTPDEEDEDDFGF